MERRLADDYVVEREGKYLCDPVPREIPFQAGTSEECSVVCLPAQGLALIQITEEGKRPVGIVALALDAEAGAYIAVNASHLRNFGAGCLSLADDLDKGKGKQ